MDFNIFEVLDTVYEKKVSLLDLNTLEGLDIAYEKK